MCRQPYTNLILLAIYRTEENSINIYTRKHLSLSCSCVHDRGAPATAMQGKNVNCTLLVAAHENTTQRVLASSAAPGPGNRHGRGCIASSSPPAAQTRPGTTRRSTPSRWLRSCRKHTQDGSCVLPAFS
jgi:hypothetical protein